MRRTALRQQGDRTGAAHVVQRVPEWLLPARLGYREGGTAPQGWTHIPALPAVSVRPYLSVRDRTSGVSGALHHDELKIDLPRVRALVDRSHPDFAALPLRQLEPSGSTMPCFGSATICS